MSYLDLEERPVIVRQVFPAVVTLDEKWGLSLARLVLTRAAVYVWQEPGEPYFHALHTATDLAGTFDPPSRLSTATTADGLLSWSPGAGCGCSHPLKHHRPFAPTRLS